MLASQRKQQILQILTEEKQVMSGELSQRFNVSEDSIRRDLRELAAEGKRSGSTAAHCRFLPLLRLLKRAKACRSPPSRLSPAPPPR